MTADIIHIRSYGIQDYLYCWNNMQVFTQKRTTETLDEIWLLEHYPVYTQGQNGKPEHILQSSHIPIIQTDRGGQVTYHGPGQLMCYTLIDLKRKKITIREFVTMLEQSVITLLAGYSINAYAKREAPGIYIKTNMVQTVDPVEKKIASLGLRVKRGCTYHGLALNINMDLMPFTQINPCGCRALQMTQLNEFVPCQDLLTIGKKLVIHLMKHLGYLQVYYASSL
jgi:lipoyl(octanoyl) transferase